MESVEQYGERYDYKIQVAMWAIIILSMVGVVWMNIAYSYTQKGDCQPSDYTYCGPVEGYFGGVNGVSTISHGAGHGDGHKDAHGAKGHDAHGHGKDDGHGHGGHDGHGHGGHDGHGHD